MATEAKGEVKLLNVVLSKANVDGLLSVYHGFHDAGVESIRMLPESCSGFLLIEVYLTAQNYEKKCVEHVKLVLREVLEVKYLYNAECDYPNIRDDISIGFFDNLVFIDFGSACENRCSPDDFRESYNYFVCRKVELFSERKRS